MTWNLRKNSKFRVSCQSETKVIGNNRCTLLPFMTAWTMSRSLLLMLTNPKEEKDGGRGRRSWVPTEQHMESLVNECQWARSKRRQNWCWRSHKRQKFEKKIKKKGARGFVDRTQNVSAIFFISFRRLHQICQDCKVNHLKGTCEEPITTEYCKMAEKMKFNCINLKHMGAKNLIWMKMIWKNMNKSASFDDFLHVVLHSWITERSQTLFVRFETFWCESNKHIWGTSGSDCWIVW